MRNRKKIKKISAIIFSLFFLTCIFLPFGNVLKAQDSEKLQPRFNPICWEKKACETARADFVGESNAKAAEGWLEDQLPCDQKGWGMCLPGNVTTAQVSFGGSDKFTNVGDYIKTVYNYSIVMIGIIAVVVIIIAGAQWITSGGNGEVIKQSQKRITGAIIGLFIAFMSFNILQSINPATINLRLPQVYMVRPQILPSKWCRELDKKTEFAFGAEHKNQSEKIKATKDNYYNLKYPYDDPADKKFWCGQRYFVGGASAETWCWGDRCDKGEMCTDADAKDKSNSYACRKASVAGEIFKSGGSIFEKWTYPWVTRGDLLVVCANSVTEQQFGWRRDEPVIIGGPAVFSDKGNDRQSFYISVSPEEVNKVKERCSTTDNKYIGFLLRFRMSQSLWWGGEDHIIGVDGNKGVDLGCSESFNCISIWKVGDKNVYRNLSIIYSKYFILLSEIESGKEINVDVSQIYRWLGTGQSDFEDWKYTPLLNLDAGKPIGDYTL